MRPCSSSFPGPCYKASKTAAGYLVSWDGNPVRSATGALGAAAWNSLPLALRQGLDSSRESWMQRELKTPDFGRNCIQEVRS